MQKWPTEPFIIGLLVFVQLGYFPANFVTLGPSTPSAQKASKTRTYGDC